MRHYLMELVGAFFLTFALVTTGNPIAVGLMFMAMYYIGERVSGGYYNPALAVAGWVRGVLSVEDMLIYSGVETVGAFLAVWLYRSLFNIVYMPEQVADNGLLMACLVQGLLAAVFASVFLTCATSKDYKGSVVNGVVIGLTLSSLLFISELFNPAIAAGSYLGALLAGDGSGRP